MGVSWGVAHGKTEYGSREYYLNHWEAFCAAGLCYNFVFPVDDVLYEFKQKIGGGVLVTAREDLAVIAGMRALSCGDGTYEMFDRITDGIDLYVPDAHPVRRIDRPEFEWSCQRAGSLGLLFGLPAGARLSKDVKRLARELQTAARFCRKHRLMIGISY